MKIAVLKNKKRVNEVVEVHMQSFTGFFLTFLGKGFLRQLYSGFIEHPDSGLIVAVDEGEIVGFLAYSEDISAFYKHLIKKRLLPFAWYAGWAFLRNPKILFRLLRAFRSSGEAKREERYIELLSIGVLPKAEGRGVGSKMTGALKKKAYGLNEEKRGKTVKYEYIKLETDAVDNEYANHFYVKNGFLLHHEYETREGRRMNEYRFYLDRENKEKI